MSTLFKAVGEHLFLAYSALFVAIVIAIPLAVISLYNRYLASILLILSSVHEYLSNSVVQ